MATLETQYKNFLKSNPTSTFTFEEWKKKWADDIRPIIEELNNPPVEWKLYEQYTRRFVGYEDIPDYEWFKHELEHNEAFREKFVSPLVSDDFQIGPEGAYEATEDSIYCPVCSGCGEDGCCKATNCKMDPNGHYCDFYLNDLKIGYLMDEWFTNNMYNELTEEQKVRYDEAYEQVMDKVYGKDNSRI